MKAEQIMTRKPILLLGLILLQGILVGSVNAQPTMAEINRRMPPPLALDRDRIEANGIAIIESSHLRLITDLRDRGRIRELIEVFDAAVGAWAERFEIDPELTGNWVINCICMQNPESLNRFRAARLIPDHVPPFPAGFNRGHEIWMYAQPGEYYSRHLLLHEGTHAFMQWFIKGSGPPWYSEGMAELLAVHQWADGKLKLGLKNCTREGTEYWGRPAIIQKALANDRGKSLVEVLDIPNRSFLDVNYYGWAWAACRFLDQHPISQSGFRSMIKSASKTDVRFNVTLRNKLRRHWEQLEREWEIYTREMEYSYSIEQAVVTEAKSVTGKSFEIASEKGWQRTGISLEKGETIQLEASGRFIIHKTDGPNDRPWECESNGVTIRYYKGKPLGILEAMVVSGASESLPASLAVGTAAKISAKSQGELWLRINDHPAEREDNSGSVLVKVQR